MRWKDVTIGALLSLVAAPAQSQMPSIGGAIPTEREVRRGICSLPDRVAAGEPLSGYVDQQRLFLLHYAPMPAVTLEIGQVTSDRTVDAYAEDCNLYRIAAGTADAVRAYRSEKPISQVFITMGHGEVNRGARNVRKDVYEQDFVERFVPMLETELEDDFDVVILEYDGPEEHSYNGAESVSKGYRARLLTYLLDAHAMVRRGEAILIDPHMNYIASHPQMVRPPEALVHPSSRHKEGAERLGELIVEYTHPEFCEIFACK